MFEQGRLKAIGSVNARRTLDSCCGLNMTTSAAAAALKFLFTSYEYLLPDSKASSINATL